VPSPVLSIAYTAGPSISRIHGARTNQVRRASPAASHVVSNVFPQARVDPAPPRLRPKISSPSSGGAGTARYHCFDRAAGQPLE
jgi:hypothetical protein